MMKNLLISVAILLPLYLLNAQSNNSCSEALNSTSISAGMFHVENLDGDVPPAFCSGGTGTGVSAGEWFKYIPNQNYTVTISSDFASNSNKDTRFHVFVGNCASLSCVAGDDDSGIYTGTNGTSNLSKVTFPVLEGQTYFIVWDNRWSDSSNFDFMLMEDEYEASISARISFTQQSISTVGDNRAVVDMNGDFLDDLVSIGPTNININYQLASGGFNNVNINTTTTNFLPSWSLAAGDYDANGYNDLLYADSNGVTFMKANSNGIGYTEISGPENVFSQRSNFVDINNDGHLDAFVCHDLNPSVSYMNDGNNNLIYQNTNGLGNYASGGNYGSVWVDFDNDGDVDMFIAKCGGNEARRKNELYRNNGDGTYTEIGASAGLDDIIQTWSSAWGDFDNDGYMDVYVGSSVNDNDNKLMRNNGDGTFTDVSINSGILETRKGYENIPGDFDNDGIIDIYSNGDMLFGNGDMTFTLVKTLSLPVIGAIGDVNNDGFLDMFHGGVYVNNGNTNNWIKIITIGNTEDGLSNKNGIGARLEINTDTGSQIRDVRSGEGFRFMHSLNTHFGIGQENVINYVKVIWPSGTVDIVFNPEINESLTVIEGSTLSIKNNFAKDLILYPKPATSNLYLASSENLSDIIYSVFDMTGKRVLNSRLNSNNIDISTLASGNYLLQIVSGNQIKIEKFIKN